MASRGWKGIPLLEAGLEWQLQAHQSWLLLCCSSAKLTCYLWSKMIAYNWQHFHSFEKMYLKSSCNDSPARWGWPLGWSVTSCRFCGGTSYLSAFHTPSPSYLLLRPLNEFVPVGTDGRGCPGQRVGILAPQQKIWFHVACGYVNPGTVSAGLYHWLRIFLELEITVPQHPPTL